MLSYPVYILASILETLLRLFPFPAKTGLVRIGNPNRSSPVLLTGNFHLTVLRVIRALCGSDVYLLIANSRGINVWCAATGGLLTNHEVISALKTSGIEELVDHRKVILSQLTATGIEPKIIKEKTGWQAIFGPVYIRDIKDFLTSGVKDHAMRQVSFHIVQRLEMATAWAFPLSVITFPALLLFWPQLLLPLILLIWGLSSFIFLFFPVYSRWLNPQGKRDGFIFFDFRHGGFLLILWGLFLLGLAIYNLLSGGWQWGFFIGWGISSLAVILLLSLDLLGSTPVFKSSLHEDRLLKVTLDRSKCRGSGLCQDVCPRNCFHLHRRNHKAAMPRADLCVRCGACLVQCPGDALSFQAPGDRVIPPQAIRQYKLNLLGKRITR